MFEINNADCLNFRACATGFPDANYVDPMNKAVFKYKLMEHIIEIASFVGEDPFKVKLD